MISLVVSSIADRFKRRSEEEWFFRIELILAQARQMSSSIALNFYPASRMANLVAAIKAWINGGFLAGQSGIVHVT